MFSGISDHIRIAITVLIAFNIAYFSTPWAMKLALKTGAIDRPDGGRHLHSKTTPRLGGLAIFAGFAAAVLLFAVPDTKIRGILLGSLLIVIMGAVDDAKDLKPFVKLLFQICAAVIAIFHGLYFSYVTGISGSFSIGVLSYPLTVLWIVGCTNAVNLIDGLDGLALGISAVSSFTMLIVALFVAEPAIAIVFAALGGACVGFMPYNLHPAKIFMGDTGSQLLGYVLATASIMGLFKLYAFITFLVPLMSLAVPLMDTGFAFFRRLANGQSPFKADKGHFHHRLLAAGFTQTEAVVILCSISALFGLLSIALASVNRLTEGNYGWVPGVCGISAVLIVELNWHFVFKRRKARMKALEERPDEFDPGD